MLVDIFGAKVELPDDQAKAVIAGRDADKEERRKLAERIGAIEAEKQAAEAAQKKAVEDAKMADLTKKGEFDKVLELKEKAAQERIAAAGARVSQLADKFRDQAIRAYIATNPKVAAVADPATRAAMVDLYVAQLKPSCHFDIEKDSLQVLADGGAVALNSEGKPKQADAWVSEILDASPLLKPPPSPGSGAGGSGKSEGAKPQVAQVDFDKKAPLDQAKFLEAGGVIVG